MGTNLIRAMLLASASVTVAAGVAPSAALAQESSYQIDIPAQSMDDALRALGKATKQNIVFSGSTVRGKRSVAVRGRMTASEALSRLIAGSGLKMSPKAGGFMVQGGNADAAPTRAEGPATNFQGAVTARAGSVIDARTGAALKGAIVEIVETGEKVSTGDLGEFRFPGKNGSYNLRIAYLGYPEYEQFVDLKDGRSTAGILLSDGGGVNEIVVTAFQSARAQALNQERTKDNSSTIISSDLLGQFNGTTISDAMRRAPGVAFERDAETGDGTNVIVRGLPSEFNQVTINGQQLPVGGGIDRNPNLGNVLADSVSKITINKTLTAAQDSSGTGGLIEIETASPLDRPRRYASFTAEGVKRGKGFGSDYTLAGTLSGRFGASENFGVSVSFQRRRQDVANVSYGLRDNTLPSYLPLDVDGTPMALSDYVDPRSPFPFEDGVDQYYPGAVFLNKSSVKSVTNALNVALEWQPFEGTNWSVDYLSSRKTSDTSTGIARIQNVAVYLPTPIVSLGGETRFARTTLFSTAGADISGREGAKDNTDSISFNGTTTSGLWSLAYRGGYSKARASTPLSYAFSFGQSSASGGGLNPSMALPEAFDPATGLLTSYFGPRSGTSFPRLLLNAEGLAYVSSDDTLLFGGGNLSSFTGQSRIWTGEFSAKREFEDSIIRFIEAGIDLKSNKSTARDGGNTAYSPVLDFSTPPFLPPISALGLTTRLFGYAGVVGETAGFVLLSDRSVIDFIDRLPEFADDGTFVSRTDSAPVAPSVLREREVAAFAQAKLEFGNFDALIGLRYNRVNVASTFVSAPAFIDENGFFDEDFARRFTTLAIAKGKQENWLPRALINYRPSKNAVIRAGYFSTVARPRIDQLTSAQGITLNLLPFDGPEFNQPSLRIAKPNPDIRPSRVHNFDISFERYFQSVGAIKIAGFYKMFKNLPESSEVRGTDSLNGVELPDDPRFRNLPDNIFIVVTQPYSSDFTAKSWGIELSGERQLDFIHSGLKGLGVYLNYTYADSSKVLPQQWFGKPVLDTDGSIIGREVENYVIRGVSFDGQPKHSGTVGLTFSRYGVDASLYYSVQGRRRTGFRAYNLHEYDEGADSLDLRVQYSTKIGGADTRFYIVGNDLLKGRNDARVTTTRGGVGETPKYYIGGTFLGGREVSAGVTVSF